MRVVQPAIQKNFKNELRVVEPTMYFLKIFTLRVVEPAMYFYKIFWLAGSTTRNVKILRKYIAGSTTRNVFEKKFTLRVVEPTMCFENVYTFFCGTRGEWMEDTMVELLWWSSFSLVQEENSGKNFEGAGTYVWRYGGAGSLEVEMIEGWKEEMMKV